MPKRTHSVQLTAFLLGLICLWISSGATLHHTDDDSALFRYHVGRIALSHLVPPAKPIPCAACEWELSVSDIQTPTAPVICLPLFRMP